MDNPLILPQIGLIFWTCVVFCILLFLLKKFAWKPILSAVKERESKIEEALESAENAKLEMAKLKSQNDDLKKEALAEREAMMKEAKEIKAGIIADAKGEAKAEADRIIESARAEIKAEKAAAMSEIKSQVATLSIDIAEKIVKKELSADDKQKALVDGLIEDVNLN